MPGLLTKISAKRLDKQEVTLTCSDWLSLNFEYGYRVRYATFDDRNIHEKHPYQKRELPPPYVSDAHYVCISFMRTKSKSPRIVALGFETYSKYSHLVVDYLCVG